MLENSNSAPLVQRLGTGHDPVPSQMASSSHTCQDCLTSGSSSPPSISSTRSQLLPSSRKPSSRQNENIQPRTAIYQLRHDLMTRRTGVVISLSLMAFLCLLLASKLLHTLPKEHQDDMKIRQILQPSARPSYSNQHHLSDPRKWLVENSDNYLRNQNAVEYPGRFSSRPKAALITLVRNEELEGILQSMRQLEYHWNSRYRYPWMFFSEKSFSDEFKAATTNATSAPTSYHLIPRAHWSTPDWVDPYRHHDSLTYLHSIGVGKGHMPSYRHMCRWNSGFFYHHPALASYEYYWRIEPDVHFFCDIDYDPFRFLRDNELVYGFNMNILDDARSFASLWRYTKQFVEEFSDLVHPDADMRWLVDGENGGEYNNCQFFSNFEIGSLDFFRGEGNTRYFRYLDEVAGGFFYERYGDAPIHTLSVAMFAPKDKVWFFRDIGYQHDIARHCPADGVASGKCTCEPTGLDENFYKLVPMESPQRKPGDTCIRLWLGGDWLQKKEGWDQETERTFGGDGYGGYLKDTI